MDKLIQEVASPRTHGILKGYQERSKVQKSLTFFDPGLNFVAGQGKLRYFLIPYAWDIVCQVL